MYLKEQRGTALFRVVFESTVEVVSGTPGQRFVCICLSPRFQVELGTCHFH